MNFNNGNENIFPEVNRVYFLCFLFIDLYSAPGELTV